MQNSVGVGVLAVCAISGSVALIALQVQKRLLSDFMKKMELQLHGSDKLYESKKKVRFAEDVMEPSSNNKEYRRKCASSRPKPASHYDDQDMPMNRQILYRGIRDHNKMLLRGYTVSKYF